MFLETTPLAIFSKTAKHNKGKEPYPVNCKVFKSLDDCWEYLQSLHNSNTAYNLLFKNNRVFCLPRKPAKKDNSEFNVPLYGWAEMSGVLALNSPELYKQVALSRLLETIKPVSAE